MNKSSKSVSVSISSIDVQDDQFRACLNVAGDISRISTDYKERGITDQIVNIVSSVLAERLMMEKAGEILEKVNINVIVKAIQLDAIRAHVK